MSRISDTYNYDPQNAQELLSKSIYRIPAYQRGYAWNGEGQVKVLLDDLRKAFEENNNNLYFLGEVTVIKAGEVVDDLTPIYEVIDGQQRLTTLQLIVMCLYSKISKFPTNEIDTAIQETNTRRDYLMSRECFEHSKNPEGKYFRVVPNGDVLEVLHKIKLTHIDSTPALEESFHSKTPETQSQEKIYEAWDAIGDYIDKNFHRLKDQLRYLSFILNNSVIVRLNVGKAEQALDIFWKANGRGLPLTDADLLKNMLFMNISSEQFEKVEKQWNAASQLLFAGKKGKKDSMLPFLKSWSQIIYGKNVSQSEVFSRWTELLNSGPSAVPGLTENANPEVSLLDKNLTTEQRTLTFAQLLNQKAQHAHNIHKGKHPTHLNDLTLNSFGTRHLNLQQQSQVLLAGSHLSESSYQHLLDIVETRSLLYQFSMERVQDFERVLHPWSKRVASLPNTATRGDLLEAAQPALENLDEMLNSLLGKLMTINYGVTSHRKLLRYSLSRVTAFAQTHYFEPNINMLALTKDLVTPPRLENQEKGNLRLQLDHIFPKAQSRKSEFESRLTEWLSERQESGESPERIEYWRRYDFINCIGNMSLLKSDENLDQSDILPGDSNKINHYCGISQPYLINAAISSQGESPNASAAWRNGITELRRISKTDLSDWGPKDILSRAQLYSTLMERDFRIRLT